MTFTRVYIAGPYSDAPESNVRRAFDAWHELADMGFIPFCPHLTHYLHRHRPRDYAEWLNHDLVWLALCYAVLRLAGDSPGADLECLYARERGIPVFNSIPSLSMAFGRQKPGSRTSAKELDAPERPTPNAEGAGR